MSGTSLTSLCTQETENDSHDLAVWDRITCRGSVTVLPEYRKAGTGMPSTSMEKVGARGGVRVWRVHPASKALLACHRANDPGLPV